jgi:predicted RNA methylase
MSLEEAYQAVQEAREASSENLHGRAVVSLLKALDLVPQLAPELGNELAYSVCEFSANRSAEEKLALFEHAATACPIPPLLHNLGALLFQEGLVDRALTTMKAALRIDIRYKPAYDGLINMRAAAVDAWHWRMLNDQHRNVVYQRAISAAVTKGCTVVDIGAGTGLLSIMAAKAGAGHVVAIEMNGALCNVAAKVAAANDVSDVVEVVHGHSSSLDIAEPVDLIITELVDSGLLGEKIIPVLLGARRLLKKPTGKIIPSHAKVHICLIESSAIRARTKRAGFTLEEEYTCENLAEIDCHTLTVPAEVLEIDLAPPNWQPIKTTSHLLDVVRSGRVDAVCVWFDLFLDRCGNHVISSIGREGNSSSGWDHAIFPVPDIIDVHKGTAFDINVAYREDGLIFDCCQTKSAPEIPVEKSCEMDLSFLNDVNLQHFLKSALAMAAPGKKVLDITSGLRANLSQLLLRSTFADSVTLISGQDSEGLLSLARDRSFTLVLCADIIDSAGVLRDGIMRDLVFFSEFLAAPGALYVPSHLSVICAGFSAENLWRRCRVASRTCGIDLRPANVFSTAHLREIDLKSCRRVTSVAHVPIIFPPSSESAFVEMALTANQNFGIVQVDAVGVWFSLGFADEQEFNSFKSENFRQAVTVLPCPLIAVSPGQQIHVVICIESASVISVNKVGADAVSITCIT